MRYRELVQEETQEERFARINAMTDEERGERGVKYIAGKLADQSIEQAERQAKWEAESRAKQEQADSLRDYEGEAQTWSAMIQRDCASFLSQVEDPFSLFKGLKAGYRFEKKAVRLEDRQSVEMQQELKDSLNTYWKYVYGQPFRNSLFAFGSPGQAEFFGNVHAVFPIGDFEFLWSPVIDDLNYHTLGYMVHNDPVSDWDGWIPDKNGQALVAGIKKKGKYQNTDLEGAIDSGNEIMIRVKNYYIMDIEDGQRTGQLQLIRDILG